MTKRRDTRREPSFASGGGDGTGDGQAGGPEIPAEGRGPRPGGRGRRRRARRRGRGIIANLFLLAFAAALGAAGLYGYERYMEQHVSLEGLSLEAGSSAGDAEYARPAPGEPLGEAGLRWCLREEVFLEVLVGVATTNRELSRISELQVEAGRLCDLGSADPAMLAAARDHVSSRREELMQAAMDAQLLVLGGEDDGQWSSSEMVADIQTLLDSLGYDVGTVDGLYGTQTRVAIKAFERDRGLPESGAATVEVLRQLRKAASEGN